MCGAQMFETFFSYLMYDQPELSDRKKRKEKKSKEWRVLSERADWLIKVFHSNFDDTLFAYHSNLFVSECFWKTTDAIAPEGKEGKKETNKKGRAGLVPVGSTRCRHHACGESKSRSSGTRSSQRP